MWMLLIFLALLMIFVPWIRNLAPIVMGAACIYILYGANKIENSNNVFYNWFSVTSTAVLVVTIPLTIIFIIGAIINKITKIKSNRSKIDKSIENKLEIKSSNGQVVFNKSTEDFKIHKY